MQLQAHPIVNLVVRQRDVVLIDGIPIGRVSLLVLIPVFRLTYHFFRVIFEGSVPVCAAINFFKSPTVSSELHLTRTEYWSEGQKSR